MRMTIFNIPFGYSWGVRTPPVIRVMESIYVEAFFKSGALRISSFEFFRKHSDERRRDGEEGTAVMEIKSQESTMSAVALNGQEAYVLCASTVEPELTADQDGLIIDDTIAFSAAVSRFLPGFMGGTEGLCTYRSNTLYKAFDSHEFGPPADGEDPEKWAEQQERIAGLHMQNKFFIKHSRFSHESEYRMIWFCSGKPKDYIDIECADAIRFCRRLRA